MENLKNMLKEGDDFDGIVPLLSQALINSDYFTQSFEQQTGISYPKFIKEDNSLDSLRISENNENVVDFSLIGSVYDIDKSEKTIESKRIYFWMIYFCYSDVLEVYWNDIEGDF